MITVLSLDRLFTLSKATFTEEEQLQIVMIFIGVILLVAVVCCLVGLWIWFMNKKMRQAGEYTMKKVEVKRKQKEELKQEGKDEEATKVTDET